jgi:hypothetical protein
VSGREVRDAAVRLLVQGLTVWVLWKARDLLAVIHSVVSSNTEVLTVSFHGCFHGGVAWRILVSVIDAKEKGIQSRHGARL